MECNFICVKIRDKNNIIFKQSKIQEIFKLSIGNNIINFNYNTKKGKLMFNYYKKFIKKNIGKMIYKTNEYNQDTKIFNENFILNNMKRAKIIIENKQYDLKENVRSAKQKFKVEIKFIDNIIELNSMFKKCKSLSSIHNFKNLNTKYLQTIYHLFCGCSSLIYIDDISNWNINNINDNLLLI